MLNLSINSELLLLEIADIALVEDLGEAAATIHLAKFSCLLPTTVQSLAYLISSHLDLEGHTLLTNITGKLLFLLLLLFNLILIYFVMFIHIVIVLIIII